MPFGVSSMMRLATVWMNSWSWLENRMFPLNDCNVLLNAWMDSKSRWLVGVSRMIPVSYTHLTLPTKRIV